MKSTPTGIAAFASGVCRSVFRLVRFYVRGENRKGSDIDVLVEFFKVPGMLRFFGLEDDLAATLGVSVDLVQKEALKPFIGKRIRAEVLPP